MSRTRKPSPSTVLAVLALFIALGGSALAARRYLITSTSQIKPSVLKSLRGHSGPRGLSGPAGPQGAAGQIGLLGAEGPAGKKGAAGPRGAQGPPGTTVVARARSAALVTTSSTNVKAPSFAPDALTSATWTQGSEEIDQLVGRVTMTTPPESSCSVAGSLGSEGGGLVEILLDGVPVGEVVTVTGPSETVVSELISWRHRAGDSQFFTNEGPSSTWLFEPGASTSRTLTAQVADDCGSGGGNSGGHFKINSIAINVLGAS